jgi:hypothetical protein
MTIDGPGLLRDATPAVGSRPVQKFKSEPASFDLPTVAEIGLSYVGRANDCLRTRLSTTFCSDNLYLDSYRVGGQFLFDFEPVSFVVSAGTEIVPQQWNTQQEDIFGEAYGLGFRTLLEGVEVSVDFAYRATKYFAPNHVVSIALGF